MLVLLLVYAIAQSGFGDAVPTPSIERRDPCFCGEPIQTRTLWNIIWSCLSTIFLCTWVSLHPNISSTPEKPGLGRFEKWIRIPLVEFLTYKLPLFLWALLVPEYILAWAIRQYIMAGKVQKEVPGWTRTHGFFLIMGGFQLFERPDQPLQPMNGEKNHVTHGLGTFVRIIDPQDAHQHKLETIIPFTTEAEIKDRGKSDGIGKIIVILQTSWFIIQCIARGVGHLPLTELEIVTLAYAMMNFFVYVFWWDKPRDVGCPIRLYNNLTTNYVATECDAGFAGLVQKVVSYILGSQDQCVMLSLERKVPIFWSGNMVPTSVPEGGTPFRAALGPSILGMPFGAVHCIAFSYSFPSHTELVLWRISCIAMIAVPFFSTFVCANLAAPISRDSELLAFIVGLFVIVFGFSAWLYIAARIATMVMAFTTLRSLPSEAFAVVDWTTFIPHI